MRLRWLVLVLGLAACGDGGEASEGALLPSGGTTLTPSTPAGAAALPAGATSGTPTTPTTPSATGATTGATPGTVAVTGSEGTPAPATGTGLPCNVEKILKDKCQTCHGNPLMSGPMPLVTQADLSAASTAAPGSKILDRVKARIHDSAKPMPPASRPPLTAEETKILDAYLAAGAPSSREACVAAPPTATANAGVGGDWQPPDSDCEVMMELRAHGGQTEGDTTPYEAPLGGDSYEIFYFRPTWTKKMHVIRIDPITDNGAVLHHWLLYMEDGNGNGSGTHQSDSGLQGSNSQLLSGWAPGNKQIALGKEVGMQVIQGPNARFAAEFHFNTSSNPPNRKDRSGIRLCLTSKLRPKEAGTHWLGTNVIANLFPLGGTYSVSDVCEPIAESHIIAYSPHMHKYGRSQKSVVTRKDGKQEVINDGPFAFDDQQIYPVKSPTGEIVVGPGDKITTTCNYDGSGAFTFGPGTADEMCYNFVVAWPVGSLTNGVPGLVGGKNSCIGSL